MCKNLLEELQLDGVMKEELHRAGTMVDKHVLVEGDRLTLKAQRSLRTALLKWSRVDLVDTDRDHLQSVPVAAKQSRLALQEDSRHPVSRARRHLLQTTLQD